jgi:hypothetical protein
MRQRGQTTTFQMRLEISEYAAAVLNDTHIATAVGCSVWMIRKWRRRATQQGRVGLTSHMGRAASGPMSTFPNAVKEAILQLRHRHPGWGPATLRIALRADERWRDQPLPSRARIATLLKQASTATRK